MNISYKLLLTAILLTICANSVYASATGRGTYGQKEFEADVLLVADESASQADRAEAKKRISDYFDREDETSLTSKFSSMAIAAKDRLVAAPSQVTKFVMENKVKTGAGVALAAAVVTGAVVAYKMYTASEDTVESLTAGIEALKAEINSLNDAGNAKEAAAKIIARKALEAKLAVLQAKIATEQADEEVSI